MQMTPSTSFSQDARKVSSLQYFFILPCPPQADAGRRKDETSSSHVRFMKQKLFALLVLALCFTCMLVTVQAAEVNPIKVAMQLSTSTFTEPREITVSIKVSNTGEEPLPGPVTLYYPNGNQVDGFGAPVLEAGASKSWTGPIEVTQAMLDAGKITFKIQYSRHNEAGELVSMARNFSKEITYTGGVASVEINRTIAPTTAGKNQEVSITYDVINTGTLDITNVSITENKAIASKPATIERVAAGEKKSHTFTFKMGTKDMVSQAVITYTAGGESQTVSKDAATIRYGEVRLKASLSSDKKGGLPGDKVKLTLKLANSGKTDYTNIVVTDPLLGEVFAGETAPAGKTTVLEKEVTITENVDYQFTVTASDSGDTEGVEITTERVSLTALSPDQVISLTVNAEADRDIVYMAPGTVRFRVYVTNNSTVDVNDVVITASGVTLYTFPTILAGETRDFTRDVHVNLTNDNPSGKFQFVASVRNQLNETETFESNILPIVYMMPTPVPTEAPIVTPPKPVYLQQPSEADLEVDYSRYQSMLQLAANILLPVFGVLLLLSIAAITRRIMIRRHSAAAVDHLERSGSRDYSQPFDSYMNGESAQPEQEADAEASEPSEDSEKTDSVNPADPTDPPAQA